MLEIIREDVGTYVLLKNGEPYKGIKFSAELVDDIVDINRLYIPGVNIEITGIDIEITKIMVGWGLTQEEAIDVISLIKECKT